MRQRDIIGRQVLNKAERSSSKPVGTVNSEKRIDALPLSNAVRRSEGRRVVVTGVGIISPIGIGKAAFTQGLRDGKNGVNRITFFDSSSLPCQIAAEIHDFDPLKYMDRKAVLRTGRSSQFAVAGAKMALEDAGLDLSNEDPAKVGTIVGSAVSGLEFAEKQQGLLIESGGKGRISPYTGIIVFAGACSSEVSIALDLRGPCHTVSTGCSAGNDAVGYAYRFIRSGETDIMISGGTEAPIIPLIIASFSSMKALSTRNESPHRASRPFDKERDGFVLGEGAAIFVLEERQRAKARGARIYAEILGYGATSDAYHMSQPAPGGSEAIRAVRMALQDAQLAPEDINYINAHGSSTRLNDKTEVMIVRSVFGEHAYSDNFAISSTKSMVGHAMGAASSIGLAASIIAVEQGFLPPTINYEVPDPECDPNLDYVPNRARPGQPKFILSNSFAFGGKNACLAIGNP